VNVETNNPFAGPKTESASERDTSRKTLLFAAMAILVLDQLSRELSRTAFLSVFMRGGDAQKLGSLYGYISIAGIVGSILGVVLALNIGARKTVIAGAVLLAGGNVAMAIVPINELALISALGPGLISLPLYVLVGRSLIGAPELRDAWFTGTTAAVTAGSFLGVLGNAAASIGGPIFFSISGALALAVIPIVVLLLQEPGTNEEPSTSRPPPMGLFSAAIAITALSRIPDQFMRNIRDPANQYLVTAQSVFTFIGAVVLAVIYLSRNTPGREDRAGSKIAIGAVAATLSAAVIAVFSVQGATSQAIWAATILDRTATLLCTPIALGLAATIPKERSAYFAIAAVTVFANIAAGLIAFLLPLLGSQHWIAWSSAAICAAIAAILYFRTGWGRRRS
jgi:dipeptide/tripeptide permease